MAESDTFGGCTVSARADEGGDTDGAGDDSGESDGAGRGDDGAVSGRETIGNGMWLDFGVSDTSRSVVERFHARSQTGLAVDASPEKEGSEAETVCSASVSGFC